MGSCTHRQQVQMRIGRAQQRLGLQRVPHAGRLFRTWAGLPRLGTAGPRADEKTTPRHAKHKPQQHDTSYNPTCGPPGWEGTTRPAGSTRSTGPCQASRSTTPSRRLAALTAGRTASGSRARQCRCVQPSHRPPSYHPAQPGSGALVPRRRGDQTRGSRATGG